MKIQYWCSVGYGPQITTTFDTEEDFGIPDEEWNGMSNEEKEEGLHDWAMEKVSDQRMHRALAKAFKELDNELKQQAMDRAGEVI